MNNEINLMFMNEAIHEQTKQTEFAGYRLGALPREMQDKVIIRASEMKRLYEFGINKQGNKNDA